MTRAVVFRTPGLIDVRAFTTFGLNSKLDATTAIGFFGTGLKYVVSILTREGINFTVWRGMQKYVFYAKDDDFRGKDFLMCYMERDSVLLKNKQQLPYTTELGKTWKLWQAFRELYSNTLDEKGECYLYDDLEGSCALSGMQGYTTIIIEGEDFVQEFLNKDKTFLPDALRLQESSDAIQIFIQPSKHIYYRGLRVMDFEEGNFSRLTYNILEPLDLTEDRTVKYPWMVQARIAEYVVTSKDPEILKAISDAPEKSFEGRLDYTYTSEVPSDEFCAAVSSAGKLAPYKAQRYVETYSPAARLVRETLVEEFPQNLITALETSNREAVWKIIESNYSALIGILRAVQIRITNERASAAVAEGMHTPMHEDASWGPGEPF